MVGKAFNGTAPPIILGGKDVVMREALAESVIKRLLLVF